MSENQAETSLEESRCLNCDEPVSGRFCSACGQSTKNLKISFASLTSDFLSDLFHFDSKMLRSLKPLMFKPGLLTAEFVGGKRVSYLPPLRMYLFFSILFFLSVNLSTKYLIRQAEKNSPQAVQKPTEEKPSDATVSPDDRGMPPEEATVVSESSREETETEGDQKKSFNVNDNFNIQVDGGDSWLGKMLEKPLEANAEKLADMEGEEAAAVIVPLLMSALSKALFFLMPIFALFLKLLYIRRSRFYFDHLIFAFHYHTFLFIFYSLLIWINMAVSVDLDLATSLSIVLFSPLYLLVALKTVYEQGWIKTLLKFGILVGLYFFAIVFGLGISSVVAVLMV